jgi:hypothetical protein
LKKRFRTAGERVVSKELRSALDRWDAELLEKVRVADVIDIAKLSLRHLGSYALQSHFDFLIVDGNEEPLFAIEYDGAGHDTRNDLKKDKICLEAELALFRVLTINSLSEITRMNILKYLVDLWHFAHQFKRMQDQGSIAPDEPFAMWSFLRPNAKHIFDSDYNFHGLALSKIKPLAALFGCDRSETVHLSMQSVRLRGPSDEVIAYESIIVADRQIVGKHLLGIRVPSYGTLSEILFTPWEIAEFASGLAMEDMVENMRLLASGAGHVVPSADDYIAEIKVLLEQGYVFYGGGSSSCSGKPLISGRVL